ncbi:MAG: polymer-forming cytoskeletal protein [Kiritimatiellae bacterium]|nr:polymer-forming cytoskeletal protein [Kiritimatiellia bacterium]
MDDSTAKTVIAEDIEIVGSIKCTNNIQIDGKLSGDLTCNGHAMIGEKAVVKGNLAVDSVTFLGQINGNINAKDRIELKATGRVIGDIRAKRLTVEDGCSFVGKSEVNSSGVASRTAGDSKSSPKNMSDVDELGNIKNSADNSTHDKDKGNGLFGKK